MIAEGIVTGVLLVGLALVGVCAYVWSAIVQEEASNGTHAARGPIGPRALTSLRQATARLLTALRHRREVRMDRDLEIGSRKLRFEDTAELTLPPAVPASAPTPGEVWIDRPSRVLSAIQLALLILLLGGAVAATVLGIAQLVARAASR
jgi:hypothetical protein